jgi:hypothetical protein
MGYYDVSETNFLFSTCTVQQVSSQIERKLLVSGFVDVQSVDSTQSVLVSKLLNTCILIFFLI